jgi:ribonuclease P protein component
MSKDTGSGPAINNLYFFRSCQNPQIDSVRYFSPTPCEKKSGISAFILYGRNLRSQPGRQTVTRKLPKHARIHSRNCFREIMSSRQSAADGILVVYAARQPGCRPRLGLVVGKRHGNAVQRNRIKRLIREAFRSVQSEIPAGFDYVIAPRTRTQHTLEAYLTSISRVAPRAADRARRQA